MGFWWHSGSARVSHQCDWSSILAPCSCLIKVTFVKCVRSVVQFDFTKYHRFSLSAPVQGWRREFPDARANVRENEAKPEGPEPRPLYD